MNFSKDFNVQNESTYIDINRNILLQKSMQILRQLQINTHQYNQYHGLCKIAQFGQNLYNQQQQSNYHLEKNMNELTNCQYSKTQSNQNLNLRQQIQNLVDVLNKVKNQALRNCLGEFKNVLISNISGFSSKNSQILDHQSSMQVDNKIKKSFISQSSKFITPSKQQSMHLNNKIFIQEQSPYEDIRLKYQQLMQQQHQIKQSYQQTIDKLHKQIHQLKRKNNNDQKFMNYANQMLRDKNIINHQNQVSILKQKLIQRSKQLEEISFNLEIAQEQKKQVLDENFRFKLHPVVCSTSNFKNNQECNQLKQYENKLGYDILLRTNQQLQNQVKNQKEIILNLREKYQQKLNEFYIIKAQNQKNKNQINIQNNDEFVLIKKEEINQLKSYIAELQRQKFVFRLETISKYDLQQEELFNQLNKELQHVQQLKNQIKQLQENKVPNEIIISKENQELYETPLKTKDQLLSIATADTNFCTSIMSKLISGNKTTKKSSNLDIIIEKSQKQQQLSCIIQQLQHELKRRQQRKLKQFQSFQDELKKKSTEIRNLKHKLEFVDRNIKKQQQNQIYLLQKNKIQLNQVIQSLSHQLQQLKKQQQIERNQLRSRNTTLKHQKNQINALYNQTRIKNFQLNMINQCTTKKYQQEYNKLKSTYNNLKYQFDKINVINKQNYSQLSIKSQDNRLPLKKLRSKITKGSQQVISTNNIIVQDKKYTDNNEVLVVLKGVLFVLNNQYKQSDMQKMNAKQIVNKIDAEIGFMKDTLTQLYEKDEMHQFMIACSYRKISLILEQQFANFIKALKSQEFIENDYENDCQHFSVNCAQFQQNIASIFKRMMENLIQNSENQYIQAQNSFYIRQSNQQQNLTN